MKRAKGLAWGLLFALLGCEKKQAEPDLGPSIPLYHPNSTLRFGVLDDTSLINFEMAADVYKPKDQFAPQFIDEFQLSQRKFHLDLVEGQINNFWSYDPAKQELTITLDYPNFVLHSETADLGNDQRSNAFGATITVHNTITSEYDVGFPQIGPKTHDAGVFRLKRDEYGLSDYVPLIKKVSLVPDEARREANGMHLIVDGETTKGDGGRIVSCGLSSHRATINDPNESNGITCLVAARFTEVKALSSSGKLLADWK